MWGKESIDIFGKGCCYQLGGTQTQISTPVNTTRPAPGSTEDTMATQSEDARPLCRPWKEAQRCACASVGTTEGQKTHGRTHRSPKPDVYPGDRPPGHGQEWPGSKRGRKSSCHVLTSNKKPYSRAKHAPGMRQQTTDVTTLVGVPTSLIRHPGLAWWRENQPQGREGGSTPTWWGCAVLPQPSGPCYGPLLWDCLWQASQPFANCRSMRKGDCSLKTVLKQNI